MNATVTRTNPILFEGFYYVESSGEFYKGCSRCGGTGHYSFNGFDSICYKCSNVTEYRLGDKFDSEADAQKWCHQRAVRKAQADRKREAARLAKLSERDAAWAALEAEHPAVWALLATVVDVRAWNTTGETHTDRVERSQFVRNMAEMLWNLDQKPFSERMITALQEIADKRVVEAEAAAEHPAPSGRVVITGEVVSTKVVDGDYGTAYKMVVKSDEGYRVYVSIPSNLMETLDLIVDAVGKRLTFTATVTVTGNDVAFGFGSRPSKAAWL